MFSVEERKVLIVHRASQCLYCVWQIIVRGQGDNWDCLPQSLIWPITQQVVTVVTEANYKGKSVQLQDADAALFEIQFCLKEGKNGTWRKFMPKSISNHKKLFFFFFSLFTSKVGAVTRFHPLRRRQMTGCLDDCYHCVTNWWIINENTHTVGLRLSKPISCSPSGAASLRKPGCWLKAKSVMYVSWLYGSCWVKWTYI